MVSSADAHMPDILLICHDSSPYLSLIHTLSNSYAVTVCTRFEGIKKKIAEQVFDLLIIEHVPNDNIVMRALEMCRPATQQGARVILINGHPRKEFIAAAFAHGLCDYFPAPVQQELLLERVQSLLKESW